MTDLGPVQARWRRLCLEALPSRPTWTMKEISDLRIGLTPQAAEWAVLSLEKAGLVHVDRSGDGAWVISLVWPEDLAAMSRWIETEFADATSDTGE